MTNEHKETLFRKKIQSLYPKRFQEIYNFLDNPIPKTFRIIQSQNRTAAEVLGKFPQESTVQQLDSVPHTFVYDSPTHPISTTVPFQNREIYVQGLASMLPPYIAQSQGKQCGTLLDMCAAPGSKLGLAIELLQPKEIIAVEADQKRIKNLQKNMQELEYKNIQYHRNRAESILQKHPEYTEYFDIILLDVPCSNENIIRLHNQKTFQYWHPKQIKSLAKVQKKLILAAEKMLAPRGILVYSTCTYSFEENEAVVLHALQNSNVSLTSVENELQKYKVPFLPGITQKENTILNSDLSRTARILPKNNFTAFFLACFQK